MTQYIIGIVGFSLSMAVFGAAEVTETGRDGMIAIISHDAVAPWVPLDDVCFFRGTQEVGCGKVVKANDRAAEVQVLDQRGLVQVGDQVVRRNLAGDSSEIQDAGWGRIRPVSFLLAGGILASSESTAPILEVQYLYSKRSSFGIKPFFGQQVVTVSANEITTVRFTGIYVTHQYYTERRLRGFWIQIGAGGHLVSANGLTTFAPSALGVAGWRVEVAGPINLGLGMGGVFLPVAKSLADISSFRLVAQVDMGVTF